MDSNWGYLSDCLTLDPVSMQWQSGTSVLGHLPEKRGSAADVTVAGVGTYLLGGYDGSSSLSSSAFLPSGSSTWHSGPSLPQALYGACAFSYKTSFIVTGGVVNSRIFSLTNSVHFPMRRSNIFWEIFLSVWMKLTSLFWHIENLPPTVLFMKTFVGTIYEKEKY